MKYTVARILLNIAYEILPTGKAKSTLLLAMNDIFYERTK